MMESLTEQEVALAEKIYIKNLPHRFDEYLQAEVIDHAIRSAQFFYKKIGDLNRVDMTGLLNIDFSPRISDLGSNIGFSPLVRFESLEFQQNSFEYFDKYAKGHSQIYRKMALSNDADIVTCSYKTPEGEFENYINHQYPKWMTTKAYTKAGIVFGFSTSAIFYDQSLDMWFLNDPNSNGRRIILSLEECILSDQMEIAESVVTTEMPF